MKHERVRVVWGRENAACDVLVACYHIIERDSQTVPWPMQDKYRKHMA